MRVLTLLGLSLASRLINVPCGASEAPAILSPAAPWPSFRGGPDLAGWRSGKIADTPRLLWTFDARGKISSTAAITGGRVYVGLAEGGMLCLDLAAADKAGKEVWRTRTEAGIQSSPAVREGKVYFGDDDGVFRALDAARGTEVWAFKTETGDEGRGEISSSASFHQDRVLFGCYNTCLYALGAADGKLHWKFATQGPVHGSPAVVEGRTFVAGCDEQLRAVDVASGKEVAVVPMGAYSAASPAITGDRLAVGTFGAQVLCLEWKTLKLLWTYKHPEKDLPFYSSPAVGAAAGGGVVIVGGRDKLVHAMRLDDGKPLWTFPTRAKVEASPVVVGSRVIVAGLDGNLYLLDLQSGEEVWKFTAGSPLAASPAVGEWRLVVSSEDGLVYCFDLKP